MTSLGTDLGSRMRKLEAFLRRKTVNMEKGRGLPAVLCWALSALGRLGCS